MRACKVCKSQFAPVRPMQCACSPICALTLVRANRDKAAKAKAVTEKRADAIKRDKLKSRSEWAREAQTSFNAWVRARDAGNACISCGRHHQGQNHAGHYLSVGASPELRYEPLNVWLQCAPCNTYLSGNSVLYRIALLDKIGAEKLAWLEGPHPTQHYTVDQLKTIKSEYAAKARELRKETA